MTSTFVRRFIVLMVMFHSAAAVNMAAAQGNLLDNPGFTIDLSGWANTQGRPVTWSSMDRNNSGSSGSARITNDMNPSNGATPLVLTQCEVVSPNTEYSYGGDLFVLMGQPANTSARIFILTFASSGCTGEAVDILAVTSDDVNTWSQRSANFMTSGSINSVQIGLGVEKPTGETAEASAHFDNVFLQQVGGPGEFMLDPSVSVSWYNPAEGGHGIMINMLNATQAWMCWFTFDLDGNPAWICALGTASGNTIVFAEAFTVEGGNFPPLFDADQIVEVPWGSITVTITGCDSGMMQWTTSAPGFQSGSMPLVRLTNLWGNECV